MIVITQIIKFIFYFLFLDDAVLKYQYGERNALKLFINHGDGPIDGHPLNIP